MNSHKNCILPIKKSGTIRIADKPLKLGGKIETIAIEEFEIKLGTSLDESIYIDSRLNATKIKFQENVAGDLPPEQLRKQIEKLLQSPYENLVLCKMDNLGYGLFADKDIPKDTVIAIYAGTIISGEKVADQKDQALAFHDANLSVSTQHSRGIASFMQHLPEKMRIPDPRVFSQILKMTGQNVSVEQLKLNVELYSTRFTNPSTLNDIATENVRKEYINYRGWPLIVMVANENIKKGDQLGFNYSYDYWFSRMLTPEFFYRTGQVVPHESYQKTYGRLYFRDFTYTGDFQPLLDAVKEKKPFITLTDDKKNVQRVTLGELQQSLVQAKALHKNAIMQESKAIQMETICIVSSNRSELGSFQITTKDKLTRFAELRAVLGKDVFRRRAFQSTYEVSLDWLLQVKQVNPIGFLEIANLLETQDAVNSLLELTSSQSNQATLKNR